MVRFRQNLAASQRKIGLFKEAIESWPRAIRMNDKDSIYYNDRAISKERIGDYRGALSDYNKALSLKPNDPEVYLNRAVLWHDLGNVDFYQDDLEKVI